MDLRYEVYRRLECREPVGNLDRGFRAEVADAAWFLGKQWQMGEHEGEDASSPVEVKVTFDEIDLLPYEGDVRMDPRIVPPEAIVESEPGDWWTPGRRIQLGAAYAKKHVLPPPSDPGEFRDDLLRHLPHPYHRMDLRGYDGQTLYAKHAGDPLFREVPKREPADLWDPAELAYTAAFEAGGATLRLDRHDGGDIDWYSVDADATPVPTEPARTLRVFPSRLQYPGAPQPRWWQIERAAVDIGGFPPDRGHFATMLLIDLLVSHSDDWFTFPLSTRIGTIVSLRSVEVKDSFDEWWTVSPPGDWTLFQVRGLEPTSLVLWPTVTTPLSGDPLEEVVLGIDEDANLLWAVEQRAFGKDLPTIGLAPPGAPEPGIVEGSTRHVYRYRPSLGVREYWHPYRIEPVGEEGWRRFVQGRLVDTNSPEPRLMPEPQALLLRDAAHYAEHPEDQEGPVHQIEPSTIPTDGLRLRRRWMLARETSGQPRLWMQRERLPLLGQPTSGLLFDVLEPVPDVTL